MSKRRVIKAKFIPAQWPLTQMVVAWLVYRQLHLKGFGAGVYITIACVVFGVILIVVAAQIWTVEPSEPVFKEDK